MSLPLLHGDLFCAALKQIDAAGRRAAGEQGATAESHTPSLTSADDLLVADLKAEVRGMRADMDSLKGMRSDMDSLKDMMARMNLMLVTMQPRQGGS